MWLKKLVIDWLLKDVVGKVAEYLNGKKTAIGAVSLFFWAFLYVVPALYPGAESLIPLVSTLREALEGAGVVLDQELLAAGTSFTLVGLIHKLIKYLGKNEDK